MKKISGGQPASFHRQGRPRPSPFTPAAAALGVALALASPARASHASEPLAAGSHAPEVDPLDLFLDTAAGERIFLDPPGGSLAVSVEATFHTTSEGASSFGVLAFLQVPVERLLAPRKSALVGAPPLQRAPVFAEAPAARSRGRGAPSPAPPASPRASREPPPPEPAPKPEAPAESATPKPPPILVSADLARGAVKAAVKAARLEEADTRLDALASRARLSALLPDLRLRATRAIDESESFAPTEYDPQRRTAKGGTTTWLEARATFRLDRLVFADDEIAVEKMRADRAADRARLVAKVLELLDAWQRARAVEADPDAKSDARSRATLAAAAAEVSLDVLTSGWFSKAIAAKKSLDAANAGASRATGAGARCVEEAPPAAPARAGHDAAHPCASSSEEGGEE